jgi:hypothetical protein
MVAKALLADTPTPPAVRRRGDPTTTPFSESFLRRSGKELSGESDAREGSRDGSSFSRPGGGASERAVVAGALATDEGEAPKGIPEKTLAGRDDDDE